MLVAEPNMLQSVDTCPPDSDDVVTMQDASGEFSRNPSFDQHLLEVGQFKFIDENCWMARCLKRETI